MAISSLFAKFKGLSPVIVVGGAVLVTIKLLTTQTPATEESLIVKVEEDIKTDEYKDNIEIPEPEKPKEEKEQLPEVPETEVEDTEQDEEEEAEEEAGESEDQPEEKEDKEEEKEKEQQPPPATKLKFKETGVGALLGKILKPNKG